MINYNKPDERGYGTVELTVAGYYAGTGAEAYIPFEKGMQILDRISGFRSVDALSFLAKDNHKLDELRDAASDVFGEVILDTSLSGSYRFALTVHDEDRCVIIVTHDLEIAAEMDEVLMMKDGVLEREQ